MATANESIQFQPRRNRRRDRALILPPSAQNTLRIMRLSELGSPPSFWSDATTSFPGSGPTGVGLDRFWDSTKRSQTLIGPPSPRQLSLSISCSNSALMTVDDLQ